MDVRLSHKNSTINGVHEGHKYRKHTIFPVYIWLLALLVAMLPSKALAQQDNLAQRQIEDNQVPAVAIHVSELTQALETIPAASTTPHEELTTGYEWWIASWHYFTLYESLEQTLRSDGTPYVEVSDADITAGRLLTSSGKPRFPILISLASEAVRDDELSHLRSFVAAGGFLFAGSSAFTRYPDGTTRGDFALADEMGLHMAAASLKNWNQFGRLTKLVEQRLVSDPPASWCGECRPILTSLPW